MRTQRKGLRSPTTYLRKGLLRQIAYMARAGASLQWRNRKLSIALRRVKEKARDVERETMPLLRTLAQIEEESANLQVVEEMIRREVLISRGYGQTKKNARRNMTLPKIRKEIRVLYNIRKMIKDELEGLDETFKDQLVNKPRNTK